MMAVDRSTTRGMVHVGDCLAWLRSLPDESVDAVVTDPPYGLGREPDPREVLAAWLAGDEYKPGGTGFMGRAWDAFVPSPCVWQECLRVLKPGGHLLAFAGTRTYDWIVLGVRLAGLEVRDMLSWVYSTGFPKSLDASKAVRSWCARAIGSGNMKPELLAEIDAKTEGQGTALKPAVEPIVMARKPLRGTVANNVLEHGTGGLNVDGCRVPRAVEDGWPANLLHDGSAEVVALFPESGGQQAPVTGRELSQPFGGTTYGTMTGRHSADPRGDTGSAARFFYCAKATRREREAGLDHLPRGIVDPTRAEESAGRDNPRAGAGRKGGGRANVHPTVKPLALMRWLVRLVTPPGGLVIDPYTGSGTTGVAAVCEGMRFAGAELDTWHGVLAHERIAYAMGHGPSGFEDVAEGDDTSTAHRAPRQQTIFEVP